MDRLNLNDLAKSIHENAKAKGFYDVERNEGEIYMLIVSELSEALEAHRKENFADLAMFLGEQNNIHFEENGGFTYYFLTHMKDSFEDEIADTIIRILDYMYYKNPKYEINYMKKDFNIDCTHYPNVGQFLFSVVNELTTSYNMLHLPSKLLRLNFIICDLFDFCTVQKIDIMQHIELKMQYNSTREKRHGKAY